MGRWSHGLSAARQVFLPLFTDVESRFKEPMTRYTEFFPLRLGQLKEKMYVTGTEPTLNWGRVTRLCSSQDARRPRVHCTAPILPLVRVPAPACKVPRSGAWFL